MVGGDFETTNGFVSEYQYAGTYNAGTYANYYTKAPEGMKSNIYALVGNTADFWNLFESIDPHSGNYLGLFDAGKDGYAWQAFTYYKKDITKSNDDLMIQKDSIYYFSYNVAHPNMPDESASPAILQFVISYDGGTTVEPLSEPDTISTDDHDWHERHVTWKAQKSSMDVMIGVYNLNKNDGVGNDFCLDDIMFQSLSYSSSKKAFTDNFEVIVRDCENCPDITPTTKDTTICQDELPYTWHGHTFNAAGTWTDTIISKVTACDSIITNYVLHTKDCTVPCEIQIYRKWNDFLFVDNSDSIYTSFQWYYQQTPIEGATQQYYRVPDPANQTGEFYVLLNGDIETCTTTLADATRSATIYPAEKNKNLVAKRTYQVFPKFIVIVYTYDDGTIETEKHLRY